jgi:two-component system NtrC family sensor kinase
MPPAMGAVVLVLDDHRGVAMAHGRILERSGMTVVVHTSPADSLARIDAGQAFDAVLCDVRMPEMEGLEFFERACEVWPGFRRRVVFFSGDVRAEDLAFIEAHGLRLIRKPIEDLLGFVEVIREVASSPP